MAKSKSTVYLGFEDEEVTAKHAALLNSSVNKIGGTPDWPSGEIKVPSCPLCATVRPLIVQLYAPLEQSQFHRTLYIFACLNPACSQNSKSWLCVRTQHLDTPSHAELISAVPPPPGGKAKKKQQHAKQKVNWCSGVDDWGEEAVVPAAGAAMGDGCEKMDTEADDIQQQNEENGNVIAQNDNSPSGLIDSSDGEHEEDDDDESNSMENDLLCGFGQLDLHAPQNAAAVAADDPNANCAVGVAAAGAVAGGAGATANATASICAEIEGPETDVVLVETPKLPERDLVALLKHTPSSVALTKITDLTLKCYFMAVELEQRQRQHDHDHYGGALSTDHIRELYQEYKRQDEAAHSPNGGAVGGDGVLLGAAAAGAHEEQEAYEQAAPAHGDVVFHHFVSTLHQHPGQILRYSRDTLPLLIAPLSEAVPKCANCNGEAICEVQILPTLIPKLRLQQNNELAPIEFGNVLVFTCLKSCWDTPDKMRYERVIVQVEN